MHTTVKHACRLTCVSSLISSLRARRTTPVFYIRAFEASHAATSRPIETEVGRRRSFHTQVSALHRQAPSTDSQTTSLTRRSPSATGISADPLIVETDYPHRYLESPVTWIESLGKLEDDNKVGLVTLSPHIWFQTPRIDILHETIRWQTTYKKLLVKQDPVRSELKGGTKKPWPQKGTGRARFKDNRGPGWQRGGVVWGMRGPRSYYYMLPANVRVKALISALSIKLAQDDLHVVDSFDSLLNNKSEYLEALAAKRNWGLSVLFVDDSDIMPPNIAEAAWNLESFTLMPVYGLNVYSILKHETLVITLAGLRRLEERLKFAQNSTFTNMGSEKDKIHNRTS